MLANTILWSVAVCLILLFFIIIFEVWKSRDQDKEKEEPDPSQDCWNEPPAFRQMKGIKTEIDNGEWDLETSKK